MNCNRLGEESSPYLLQHQGNPVHWQPWDKQAFSEARANDKLILLSVGYTACHWCHVMAHESFENVETARIMNEFCVNIKVDREERPDIDLIYQQALAALGERGGWPLTMFLTSDGIPLWGGTYFPPEPCFGLPAFRDVITSVVSAYHRHPKQVLQNKVTILQALQSLYRSQKTDCIPLSFSLLNHVAQTLIQSIDQVHGGLQGAPKFPQFPLFSFLWRAWRRTRVAHLAYVVQLTLEHICQGGIYDHLGGGVARYSTDEVWLVPHFEKMLYDNALFVDLLTTVWQDTRQRLFRCRIEEIINWVAQEMTTELGAFAASLDADSEGKEGRFYVWSADEIGTTLGEDTPLFCRHYGITDTGQWEGYNVLHRIQITRKTTEEDIALEDSLRLCRTRLLAVRNVRPRPIRDDKILADWNGLMIQAIARAGIVFDQPTWIAMAVCAFSAICDNMTLSDHQLCHCLRNGHRQHIAVLDDYANMSLAALTLLDATADPAYLVQACHWVEVANNLYWDSSTGGYFFTTAEATDLITRIKTPIDSSVPSGNGTMAYVLARLYHITSMEAYQQRARAVIEAFSGIFKEHFPNLATIMSAFEHLHAATVVVIVGPQDKVEVWRRYVVAIPISDLIVHTGPSGSVLVQGRPAINGNVTAYVCNKQTCLPPITTIHALIQEMTSISRSR